MSQIPFDQITDCNIVEPSGKNSCLCVSNTLHTVHIDTATSGSDSRQHGLTIVGLQKPQEFKQLVCSMKYQTAVPNTLGMLECTVVVNTDSNDNVAALPRRVAPKQ